MMYTDIHGVTMDYRKKKQQLAVGALTDKVNKFNLPFCMTNQIDIKTLFGNEDNFTEYMLNYKRNQLIREGVSWDDLEWFSEFFGTVTEYQEAVQIYQESLASKSLKRTKDKIYDLARANSWDYFIILTFNPELVTSTNYDECVKKLSQWLNYMKKKCHDLKYIIVPEKRKSSAYHFHGLFANCGDIDFTDSGHFTKDGKIIYNCGNYKYGWSTATRISDPQRTISYLCKYVTKDLCSVTKGKKRYWATRNLNKPFMVETLETGTFNERFNKTVKEESFTFLKSVDTRYGKMRVFETIQNTGGVLWLWTDSFPDYRDIECDDRLHAAAPSGCGKRGASVPVSPLVYRSLHLQADTVELYPFYLWRSALLFYTDYQYCGDLSGLYYAAGAQGRLYHPQRRAWNLPDFAGN
ncbi:MAG: hypothetical protein LUH19_03505 [Lachnospiraceae bacterium]|nr:hypothetical protein [Lachnospiraceae bacterium]